MKAGPDHPPSVEAWAACRRQLAGFNVICELTVAWGEMDAYGHVNNAVYFGYFESARMAYFERIGFGGDDDIGPILAETRCRFRTALRYPDHIAVGARVARLETDRFLMEYAVASFRAGRLAAEGSGLVVGYDYAAGRKAGLPGAVSANIRQLEGLV